MHDKKIAVSLATLESHNHIVGDIERGVKVYNSGGVEFEECEPNVYWARVPHKGEMKNVSVSFTKDGQDLSRHYCQCTAHNNNEAVCRHVVAAVLTIQGGEAYSKMELGKAYKFESRVTDVDTARAYGSGDLEVLATPRLVALMEYAAYTLLEAELEEGQTSVGANINITHTAASPVGISLEITAKITSVRGRTIIFEVTASDEGGEIGKGTHTRVIVDGEKLLAKAKSKLS